MLRFEDVSFMREQLPVLHDLSFSDGTGERVAVIGPNGVGKTTLLKLANGLYHPSEGRVYLDEKSTMELRTSRIARSVGFLFQNPDRQLFSDTAEKEIAFSLKLHGLSEARIKARTDEVMRDFGLEEGLNPLRAGRSLRQITALASLVAARPRLLLLDEPTTGLDFKARQRVMDIISRLNETEGTAVVMISHDMELVSAFASRVLVLCDGRLLADGDTRRILRDEALLAQASLVPPQALGLLNRLRDVSQAETMDELLEDIIGYNQRRRGA